MRFPGRAAALGAAAESRSICLFDGEVLRVAARRRAGRRGRRAATAFCPPGDIAVGNAADYLRQARSGLRRPRPGPAPRA